METHNGNSLVIATPLTGGPGPVPSDQDNSHIRRHDFPPGFVFGTGTSAFQVEGAAAVDGKGPSVWDDFTLRTPGRIIDGSNGNVACDMYNRYKEDLQTMKKMGFDAYRFSISWPRILPGGRASAGINRAGINYYNDLIDAVIANGMKPYVTLFHWETPDILEKEYGGFASKKIVDDFRAFAELCFFEFGDRVKWWTTINEPYTYALYGYVQGTMPPGHTTMVTAPHNLRRSLGSTNEEEVVNLLPPYRSAPPLVTERTLLRSSSSSRNRSAFTQKPSFDPKEAYTVSRNLLLAHSAAVHSYRTKFKEAQQGQIGIVLSSNWGVPYDKDSEDDIAAAKRAVDFMLGWYLEPVLYGKYPDTMIEYVPPEHLANFSYTEIQQLKGSADYIGLNFYTANYVRHEPHLLGIDGYANDKRLSYPSKNKDGEPMGESCGSTWLRIVPWAIYEHLVYMKDTYKDLPPLYITECGCSQNDDHTLTAAEACADPIRVKYHQDHLANILQAINHDKMDIRGYIAWSWCDNFEWTEGYTVRFGLNYVDYKNNNTRYPKNSALWFAKFLVKAQNMYTNKRQIEDNSEKGGANKKRPRLAED